MKELIFDYKIENDYLLNKFNNHTIIDIETTGLSKMYDKIFLIGTIDIKKESKIRLLLAEKLKDEIELLKKIETKDNVITYNGENFDIPFINHKLKSYGLDILNIKNFDLYKYILNYKDDLNLPNYRQSTIEKYLNLKRDEFISGKEVSNLYRDFLVNQNISTLDPIIKHNKDELVGLLNSLVITKELEEKNSILADGNKFTITKVKFKNNILEIIGLTNLSSDYIINEFDYNLEIIQNQFKLEIQTYIGEYSNGLNCNYVLKKTYPIEDKSLIKSPYEILILYLNKPIKINILNLLKYIVGLIK